MWMWAPALACGNTFVLKPSEKDPSASIYVAELLKEAGLPDGVFNVVHGDKEAVDAILEHPDVDAVSFVGSTPIAQYIYDDRRRGTGSASRRSAARRTTWSCCPTPTSTWPPTRRSARATARPASAAWRSRPWSPSATRPTRSSSAIKERLPKVKVGAGDRAGRPRWARWSRASTATRSRRTSTPAVSRARRCVADGRETAPDGDGFFLGAVAARQRDARDGRLQGRDLRPGALGRRARRPTTRRCGS